MKKNKMMLVGLGALTAAASYTALGMSALMYAFKRREVKVIHNTYATTPLSTDEQAYIDNLTIETLTIKAFDNTPLTASLIPSSNPSDKVVICIHGYRSTGLADFRHLLRFYHDLDYTILMPDNRAHGRSGGEYVGFGYLDRLDILQWIGEIQKYFHDKPLRIALHGVSMGGAAVLMTSGEALTRDVRCIISDCSYSSLTEEFAETLKNHKVPNLVIKPAQRMSKKVIGYDFSKADVTKAVANSKTPTLFIHGSEDEFVPVRMVDALYNACTAPKQLLVVDGAAHADCYMKDAARYEEALSLFLSQYMYTE